MATDERELGGEWPVAIDGVEIGVADTGVLDVDEDFVWAWLGDWDLLVLDWTAGLLNDLPMLCVSLTGQMLRGMLDLRPLLGWDALRHGDRTLGKLIS